MTGSFGGRGAGVTFEAFEAFEARVGVVRDVGGRDGGRDGVRVGVFGVAVERGARFDPVVRDDAVGLLEDVERFGAAGALLACCLVATGETPSCGVRPTAAPDHAEIRGGQVTRWAVFEHHEKQRHRTAPEPTPGDTRSGSSADRRCRVVDPDQPPAPASVCTRQVVTEEELRPTRSRRDRGTWRCSPWGSRGHGGGAHRWGTSGAGRAHGRTRPDRTRPPVDRTSGRTDRARLRAEQLPRPSRRPGCGSVRP